MQRSKGCVNHVSGVSFTCSRLFLRMLHVTGGCLKLFKLYFISERVGRKNQEDTTGWGVFFVNDLIPSTIYGMNPLFGWLHI